MRNKRLIILLGSVCLVLVLAALPFMAACVPEEVTPPEEEEVAPPEEEEVPAPAPEVFKWKTQPTTPRGTLTFNYLEAWAARLKEASAGRIDIEVFGGGEVVPVMEQWDAVARGTLEMGFSYGGFWIGKCPVAAFSQGLPFTVENKRDFEVLLWELGLEDLIREAYVEHDIRLVRILPCLSMTMISKFPLTKVADLKGRELRSSGLIADVLTKAGAATVYFPPAEIYGALERGVIEGCTYATPSCMYDVGFHEQTSYLLGTPFSAAEGDEVIVNLDIWNSLPDDLKMLLYLSIGDLSEKMSAGYQWDDAQAVESMVKDWGITVTYMPKEERMKMTEYMLEATEEYAKDPYFAEATEIVKDYMKMKGLLD